MLIGIDASRAFLDQRTGIEEYSYRVVEYLTRELNDERVVLYVRKNQELRIKNQEYLLPKNWKIKVIKFSYFWTQLGLSLEMLLHSVDVLFVPAHTVPIIHPKKTMVTVHGLEYEFCKQAYSWWARLYMRWSIKNSCRWASKIIAVSENTKRDLMRLYRVPEEKIRIVYEGINDEFMSFRPERITLERDERSGEILSEISQTGNNVCKIPRLVRDGLARNDKGCPYLLFVGRIEERKNVARIIEAFEILKEKYKIPHKLVLAGKPGFGYDQIMFNVQCSMFNADIVELGYVSDEEKFELFKNADVFVFPSLYEGFGLPILEAQAVGCPVVTSDVSSMEEIVFCHPELVSGSQHDTARDTKPEIPDQVRNDGYSAILVDLYDSNDIAQGIYKLITDKNLRDDMVKKGLENVKRFSWEKCASEIASMING